MRRDDDQWEITTGVGATALAVAAARAMESRAAEPLVSDPYAELFVTTAERESHGALDVSADAGQVRTRTSYIGVRSRFFDRFVLDAATAGIGQTVILAAGLDARALRLELPAGHTVYELDQAKVLDFKDRALAGGLPVPRTGGGERVPVPVDLRQDWPAALRSRGFDPELPTAWLAEGLLPYLPAWAERDLLDRIHELSAPASRCALERFARLADEPERPAAPVLGVDVRELVYRDDRPDPGKRLAALGWRVTQLPARVVAERYGRPLAAQGTFSRKAVLVTAVKP
ncbi:class I SAM-dependent methyltransferase [Pseudonocardia eucalypti]|uniref:S-adenosyl-L-methionine-dependent methyltransferase n=1 Tax=Pseudonocardia eucalypti TaxID=648755 RepID=A0ABP9RCI8_9PSEU|nr:methyltransferase (TIGR00027 family) [Pseudonocardia eucalypti]